MNDVAAIHPSVFTCLGLISIEGQALCPAAVHLMRFRSVVPTATYICTSLLLLSDPTGFVCFQLPEKTSPASHAQWGTGTLSKATLGPIYLDAPGSPSYAIPLGIENVLWDLSPFIGQ